MPSLHTIRAALAPLPGPWGVAPGLRAVVAAAVVLAGSVLVADLGVGGIAYLGVACAVSFIGRGDHRARAVRVGAETLGACAGMTVGALAPDTVPWVIATAVVVGVLAGMVGRIGPASTGAAVMAVIGVAYTQFGRLPMPWWEPVLAYAVGSALLLALSVVGPPGRGDRRRRAAVATVFDAAADLREATPGAPADAARHRLALASADARAAVVGYRGRPVTGRLAAAWSDARDAAFDAAWVVVDPRSSDVDPHVLRVRAREIRSGRWTRADARPAALDVGAGIRSAVRAATEPEALATGARVGLCVGVATALALLLHPPQHAFWIALTVAVVLRPEYGAVLVRSLHRLTGTVVGVLLVAAVLAVTTSPVWLAGAAALALGLSGFAGPRLYGLAVVGVTGSALFSIALGDPHGVEPWARLLDTVLGCAIALVAGVLLWPRRGIPDQPRAFARAVDALATLVDVELGPDVPARGAVTDEAYRVAHTWRAELERDLAEPDPARAAAAWLPVALQLERTVDLVCAAGAEHREDLLALLRDKPVATPQAAGDLLAAVGAALRG